MIGCVKLNKIIINGGTPLSGDVVISGAKNAAVAIIPAAILADSPSIIENVPDISDVRILVDILQEIGAKVTYIDRNTLEIDPTGTEKCVVTSNLARKMRASYYFIGALLGKFGSASVPLPGGCDFGVRPIDQHLKGFECLGCDYYVSGNSGEDGIIEVKAINALKGSEIYMDVVTVGATVNIILAAVKAKGITVIENAAREPHIVDLANFLNIMGADIRGAGTDVIKIHGVKKLKGVNYSIIPDQIEAGTFMVAAVATGGEITIKNVTPKHLEAITAKLEEMGAHVEEYDDAVKVSRKGVLKKSNVKTMPYPGFPTDMQPQIVALLSVANGISIVSESVWDNRFQYMEEMLKFGAKVTVRNRSAMIEGIKNLNGCIVRATDLRAGVAMIIGALIAQGTTYIEEVDYIARGYENLVEKFQALGADINYLTEPKNCN